ncbi:MAG: matrixin family metalloprotease [bacterium]|nr:matrixin family metalloprotease [bacterium]
MKTKISSILILIFILLVAAAANHPQQSKNNKPQSSVNKKIFNIYRSQDATISKPSTITNNKRKDFSINRKEKKINNSQRNNKKYSVDRFVSKTKSSENYFRIDKSGNSLWDGKHWDMDDYPLKVYVKESSSLYYHSDYKDYVYYAFKLWQKTDKRIQYTFTNNSRDADIQFKFVENLGKRYEENYLGLTDYDVNSKNEIEQSTVQISLIKFGDEKVSAGEIKATIIHELGHVFGLGHSENEKDIMYPFISSDHTSKKTYDELSIGDKQAIKDAIDLGNDEKYVRK